MKRKRKTFQFFDFKFKSPGYCLGWTQNFYKLVYTFLVFFFVGCDDGNFLTRNILTRFFNATKMSKNQNFKKKFVLKNKKFQPMPCESISINNIWYTSDIIIKCTNWGVFWVAVTKINFRLFWRRFFRTEQLFYYKYGNMVIFLSGNL